MQYLHIIISNNTHNYNNIYIIITNKYLYKNNLI